jgi:hypothetical protein
MECAPELGWPENWPPPVCGSAVARVAETLADAESRRVLRAANRALMSPPVGDRRNLERPGGECDRRVECGQRRRLWFKPVIPQLRET